MCLLDLFLLNSANSDMLRYGYLEVFQRVPWTSPIVFVCKSYTDKERGYKKISKLMIIEPISGPEKVLMSVTDRA